MVSPLNSNFDEFIYPKPNICQTYDAAYECVYSTDERYIVKKLSNESYIEKLGYEASLFFTGLSSRNATTPNQNRARSVMDVETEDTLLINSQTQQ